MAAVEDEQPTSSASTFSKEEVDKLMSQGKRHFVCDEIVEAVKCFEVACLMLSKKYGALSNECADAHYQYGKSSLELARLENGVLGSALNEAVEEEADYSDEEINKNTDGQSGTTSAGASVEGTTSNKQSPNVETTAENNGGNAENKQKKEEKQDNDTTEEDTEVKMDEDNTESNMEDKSTDDNIKEEEKTGTSEEKPADEKVGESTDVKMAEDKTVENKMEGKSTVKNEDSQDKQENNKKDVSEDTSNKESTNEEQKESDEKEAVGVNDQTKKEEQKEDTEGQEGESKTTGEQKGIDDDNEIEDVDDDETNDDGPISTLQLAWESLELARIIFMRHKNTEMQLKLAQTHSLLGEIHMEQEHFADAVSELTKCLNIQKNLLKPDNRVLAETYYNLGLAYTLSMMYEESSNHYGNATDVLELRLKNIKARIEEAEQQDKGKSKASDDDPLVKDRKELTELEELIPEIKDKSLDAKNEGEKLKYNIKKELGLAPIFEGESTTSTCSSSSSGATAKPANDISHLVRKQKRKTKEGEESAENSEAPAKKPRQEGDSTTTQAENGDSVMAEAAGVEKLS